MIVLHPMTSEFRVYAGDGAICRNLIHRRYVVFKLYLSLCLGNNLSEENSYLEHNFPVGLAFIQ